MTFIGPKVPFEEEYKESYNETITGIPQVCRLPLPGFGGHIETRHFRRRSDADPNMAKTTALAPIYYDWTAYVYVLNSNGGLVVKEPAGISLPALSRRRKRHQQSKAAEGGVCRWVFHLDRDRRSGHGKKPRLLSP